jgi:hypothetical protein
VSWPPDGDYLVTDDPALIVPAEVLRDRGRCKRIAMAYRIAIARLTDSGRDPKQLHRFALLTLQLLQGQSARLINPEEKEAQ